MLRPALMQKFWALLLETLPLGGPVSTKRSEARRMTQVGTRATFVSRMIVTAPGRRNGTAFARDAAFTHDAVTAQCAVTVLTADTLRPVYQMRAASSRSLRPIGC